MQSKTTAFRCYSKKITFRSVLVFTINLNLWPLALFAASCFKRCNCFNCHTSFMTLANTKILELNVRLILGYIEVAEPNMHLAFLNWL